MPYIAVEVSFFLQWNLIYNIIWIFFILKENKLNGIGWSCLFIDTLDTTEIKWYEIIHFINHSAEVGDEEGMCFFKLSMIWYDLEKALMNIINISFFSLSYPISLLNLCLEREINLLENY